MLRFVNVFLYVLCLSFYSADVLADSLNTNAVSLNSNGKIAVKIVSAISIKHTAGQRLNFGTIMNRANTITISNNGVRSAENFSYLVDSESAPDEFKVSGPDGKSVTISLPESAVVNNTAGSGTMVVSAFTSDRSGSQTLDGSDLVVKVGGTLVVADNQIEGNYTGSYTVTVSY